MSYTYNDTHKYLHIVELVVVKCMSSTCKHYHKVSAISYNIRGSNLLSGVPDYFDRNKISSGGDLSHYSSASLY